MALSGLGQASLPACVLNLAGPELLSVRRLALELGHLLDKPVSLRGQEGPEAFLSNAQESHRRFGYPRVLVSQMLQWVAD